MAGGGESRRHARRYAVPVLMLACLTVLLGFAPLTRLVATRLPIRPPKPSWTLPVSRASVDSPLRPLPVGLPPSVTIRSVADVRPFAIAALGAHGGAALMAVVARSSTAALEAAPVGSWPKAYPYRYPPLERILDRAPVREFAAHATALGAALTELAALPTGEFDVPLPNAAPAAFAVLNRARAGGGCVDQIDLLLLLAGDQLTAARTLAAEAGRASSECPNDPTPDWLVGQAQLRYSQPELYTTKAGAFDAVATRPVFTAIATFRALQRRFPSSVAAITGLGDAYLQAGARLSGSEPFTARGYLRLARDQYERAVSLGGGTGAAAGLAHALVALGQPSRAVGILRPLTGATRPGAILELLIEAQEAERDFAGAARTGKALADAGPRSYPSGGPLFPMPGEGAVPGLADASRPYSLGIDTSYPLQDQLLPGGGAGGSVNDLSFIPRYRDDRGVTPTDPACASFEWRRDALLAGRAGELLVSWPRGDFTYARPEHAHRGCESAGNLKVIAELVAHRLDRGHATSDITDEWQNLLRWAGELSAARRVDERWQAKMGDRSGLPALRLGEVEFLQRDYEDAAGEFDLAMRRARLHAYNDDLGVDQAQLDRGAALLAAHRNAEAVALLRPLEQLGTQGYAYQNHAGNPGAAASFAAVSYYACEQLADDESRTHDLHAAAEDYGTALTWTSELEEGVGVRPEVLYNNLALVYLGLHLSARAAALERKALAADPKNPVFLMTAGFIAERRGKHTTAIAYNRRALSADPGAFPVANDLGVELAERGERNAALSALRHAVGAAPNYALGWFNLGVLESRLGPTHLLAAQGAFARAEALDASYRSRRHVLTIDGSVYHTALDLSKPLPPGWTFARQSRPAPLAAVGLLATVTLAFGLARGTSRGGASLAEQWLEPISERLDHTPGRRLLRNPLWAVAATVATFLLQFWRQPLDGWQYAAYGIGVVLLTAVAMAARRLVARQVRASITQVSWAPGLLLGLITGAAGLPWAPLPVIDPPERPAGDGQPERPAGDDQPERRNSQAIHLAAPLTLVGVALVLFIESVWLGQPLTHGLAVAALIMGASTLLPIGPLDGAHVGRTGLVAGAGIVGGALLVSLGMI